MEGVREGGRGGGGRGGEGRRKEMRNAPGTGELWGEV